MTFLTIAQRELIAAAHRRGTYRMRWGVALSAAGAAGLVLLFGRSRESGVFLFGFIGIGCLVLAGLSGLFLTSDSIAAERRDGTLGLLYLTELGPFDVLLGKLVALGVNAVCSLLAVFPVLSMAWILGGLTGGEVIRSLLVGINVLFVSLCCGLAVSAWDQRQGAVVGKTAALLGLLLVWPVITENLPLLAGHHWAAISPLMGISEASDRAYRIGPFWWHLGLAHVTGWALLGVAAMGLRKSWCRGEEPSGLGRSIARRPRHQPETGSPEALPVWAVRGLLGPSPWPQRVAWWAIGMALLIGGGVWIFVDLNTAVTAYAISAFIAGLLIKGVFAWHSVALLGEARRTGSLELLLSTPVSDREIRQAHGEELKAIFVAPFAILYTLDWIVGIMATGLGGEIGNAFWFIIIVSIGGLFLTALQCRAMTLGGLWWGLCESRPTVAFAKNFLLCTFLSLPLLYFCCIGVAVPLILISWLTAKLRRPLRVILTEKDSLSPR